MALERASWRELTELVANHVFRHQNRDVAPSIVDRDGEAHHVGHDRGGPRPGPDYGPGVGSLCLFHPLEEFGLDVWSLFY